MRRRAAILALAGALGASLAGAEPAAAGFNLVDFGASPVAVGSSPGGVAAADFDGDGIADFAVTNSGADSVTVDRGTGGGAFVAGATPSTGPAGSAPRGIVIGDLNEDGKPDMIVANCAGGCGGSGVGNLAVLLNTSTVGTISFAAAVGYTAGTNPQIPVVGDFDLDGNQDVAVANRGTNDVSVLKGDGFGALTAGATLSTNVAPEGLAVGDLNGDGKDDLASSDFGPGPASGAYSVMLNTSAGGLLSFAPTSSVGTGTQPKGIALSDLDRDGNLDMILAEGASQQVRTFAGVGNGTFTTGATLGDGPGPSTYTPVAVTTGDLNNDGKTDIVTASQADDGVRVEIGRGSVTSFSVSHSQGAGDDPVALAVGDLDGDTRPDVALVNQTPAQVTLLSNRAPPGGAVYWANNLTGAGGKLGQVPLDGSNPNHALRKTTGNPQHIAVDAEHVYWVQGNDIGRMNRDGSGFNEAFISTPTAKYGIAVDGRFIYYVEPATNQIGRANLDGTGATDAFVTGLGSQPAGIAVDRNFLYYALNAGVGRVAKSGGVPNNTFITGGGQTFGVAVNGTHIYYSNFGNGDVGRANLDGTSPVNNFIDGPSTIGTTGVAVDDQFVYWTNSGTRDTLGRAHLDGTGVNQSWVRSHPNDDPVGIAALPTRGFPSFDNSIPGYSVGNTPRAVATGDFDNDGNLDFVTADAVANTATIKRGDGAGDFAIPTTAPGVGSAPRSVAVADFSGDGRADVVTANYNSSNVSVLTSTSTGPGSIAFAPKVDYVTGPNPTSVATGDFDENGRPDFVVVTEASADAEVALNDQGTGFTFQPQIPVGNNPSSVAVGYFNSDIHQDIAVANKFDGKVAILLGVGDGTFTPAPGSPVTVGTGPQSVAIGDMNDDGFGDIVVVNATSGTTSVLLGVGNGTFGAPADYPSGPSPYGLVLADFNGDNRLDIATSQTNGGSSEVQVRLNTGTGSGVDFGAPLTLGVGADTQGMAAGDFNRDAAPDIVAARTGSNHVLRIQNFSALPFAPVIKSSSPGSPANDNSPEFIGDADPNTTVDIYGNLNCLAGSIASGTGSTFKASGISVGVADDNSSSYTATAGDEGGNVSACSIFTPFTYTEDSTPPATPTGLSTTPAGGSQSDLTPEVNGTTDLPTTVDVYLNTACTGAPAATGTFGGGFGSGITVTVPPNAVTTIRTRARDVADNPSGCSAPITYTTDSTGPANPSGLSTSPGSPSNSNQPAIRGTAEPGSTVRLYTNAACTAAALFEGLPVSGPAASFASPGLFADVPPNSTTTFYVTATDATLNVSGCAGPVSYVEDSTAPIPPTLDLAPVSPANDNSPRVSGTAEPGSTVTVFRTSDCTGPAAASGSAAQLASGFTMSVPDDSSTSFSSNSTDAAGNTSGCSSSATYVEKSTSPAPPPPEQRKTANVTAKSGTVLVKCPGQAESKLEGEQQIKLGCRVDATDGVVTLVTKDINGKLQEADFYDGAFVVRQLQETETVKKKKVKVLITELTLDVAKPTACTKKATLVAAARGGHLWGHGKGRYRTRGRRGSGAVRGTTWLTEERCEGTFFQVKDGIVEVKDFTLKKTVLLKKGKSYLAPAKKK
ncbi:MAG: hypothetical protein QOE06_1640 [Thermoleophilaceae bacterium]|nr:hypothetical protein [Thermoleophilaceae bacterium]